MTILHSKPWIVEADQSAVKSVLSDGLISQGGQTRRFEDACARYLEVAGAIAVGSGTAGLILALRGLELKQGSDVILPTYVCRNVAEAVLSAGHKPIFCDVGEDWNMTPETVARAFTQNTAAIIIVHLFGIPVRTVDFKRFGVPLIEDACQAFGASLDGHTYAGASGDVGVFSFHATKCLTTGEGGGVVSNNLDLLMKMRNLRDGRSKLDSRFVTPISDLQASLGISQISRYTQFLELRKRIAERYFSELVECPISLPHTSKNKSIFFRFPVRAAGGLDAVQDKFATRGIHVRRGVDALLHQNISGENFPHAELLFKETISLPIYPALSYSDQGEIISACRAVWGTH